MALSPQNSTAEITPRRDASGCDETDCSTTELLAEVDPRDDESRILCPTHRVEYLREVTDR